ncbi:SDR family oxidoreductase [Rhodobacterales bacterium HKCCE2091]|nr:SDR family oxidoreductase [Rhodobacterales bacterium HKCCE2091]
MSMNGRSILVTGGGSGLGEGIARHLCDLGAKVTITGRRAEKLDAVAGDIGPACHAVAGDITVDADRRAMIAGAVEHGGHLDGLVNTAANMLNGPITSLEAEKILDVFNANVVAGMALTGLAAPEMEAAGGGAVLFFGSVHTRRSYPGASPYAATKGAVEVLARVLAAELGPKGIRVNCLIPGAVPTELNVRAGLYDAEASRKRLEGMIEDHPMGRIGTPFDIAEAAAHLLTAEWTTGASLVVDGGLALGVTYK